MLVPNVSGRPMPVFVAPHQPQGQPTAAAAAAAVAAPAAGGANPNEMPPPATAGGANLQPAQQPPNEEEDLKQVSVRFRAHYNSGTLLILSALFSTRSRKCSPMWTPRSSSRCTKRTAATRTPPSIRCCKSPTIKRRFADVVC